MSSFKLKILLIRWFGVGKIIDKIAKSHFGSKYALTSGVEILTKDAYINNEEFAALNIWDIIHNQRFEFIESTFFKGSA